MEQEQVYIGIGIQFPTPVVAQRHQDDFSTGLLHCRRGSELCKNELINQLVVGQIR